MRRNSGGDAGSVGREIALRLATAPGSAALVSCAKGIERGTHAFMTGVLAEAAPDRPRAILSGPSFAADVAAGLPTAVTLASADEDLARALCDALRGPTLRLYHSTDVRGVESVGRQRMCWRSPAASPPAAGLARARSPRSPTARGFADSAVLARFLGRGDRR